MQNNTITNNNNAQSQNSDTYVKAVNNCTKNIIGADAILQLGEQIKQIVPIGAGVLLICDQQIFDNFGVLVERILRRVPLIVQRDFTLVGSGLNKNILDSFELADGVRAVVSVGGGRAADAAKYIAFLARLPLVIVATSTATISYTLPSSLVAQNGFTIKINTVSPNIYVADYAIIRAQSSCHLASGFGELASRIFALLEYKFYCVTNGKPVDFNYLKQATSIIDGVLKALDGYTRGVKGVAELVVDCGSRLCSLRTLADNDALFDGADTGFCASLAMLFCYEKRAAKLQGENHFVLSRILTKVYRGILENIDFFMLPPSNNKRISALKQYYGVSEFEASKHISASLSAGDLRLKLYRLNEYSQELFTAITEVDAMLEESYKIFKRLYDDDGYSLMDYIDSADAQLALALAPDCFSQDTMLTLLKNMGITDKYII